MISNVLLCDSKCICLYCICICCALWITYGEFFSLLTNTYCMNLNNVFFETSISLEAHIQEKPVKCMRTLRVKGSPRGCIFLLHVRGCRMHLYCIRPSWWPHVCHNAAKLSCSSWTGRYLPQEVMKYWTKTNIGFKAFRWTQPELNWNGHATL